MKNFETKFDRPAANATQISAAEYNSIFTELKNVVTSSGQTLGSATGTEADGNTTQLERGVTELAKGANGYEIAGGSTANAILLTPTGVFNGNLALRKGMKVSFIASATNTNASVTVKLGSLDAKTVRQYGKNSLSVGDIVNGQLVNLTYDGTAFVLEQQSVELTLAERLGYGYLAGRRITYAGVRSVTIPQGISALDDTNTKLLTNSAGAITASLNTSGINGLASGSVANNTWYYLFLCEGASGTGVVFHTDANPANNTFLPSGYNTRKRRLPLAVRTDGSANILPFDIIAGWPYSPEVFYQTGHSNSIDLTPVSTRVLTAGTQTTFTAVDASAFVPVISRACKIQSRANASLRASFRATGQTHNGIGADMLAVDALATVSIPTNSSQSFDYKVSSSQIDTEVISYTVTEI